MKEQALNTRKILLVEDDDLLRPTLAALLKRCGVQVTAVGGADPARGFLERETFDAVISDINMPGSNGVELLKWITPRFKTPVILMTGYSDLAHTLEAHACGAAAFLSKPFRREELIETLSACFATIPPCSQPELYCELSSETLSPGMTLQHDLYARLSATSHLRIAHAGEVLSAEQLQTYRNTGAVGFYAKKRDLSDLTGAA